MLIHDSLENFYRLNIKLLMDYNMSFDNIDDMYPFEREVYVALILEELEKKKQNGIT